MGIAVSMGAEMIKYLTLTLSASLPIYGLIRAGTCMIVDRKPAWVSDSENFSIIKGSRGAKKLE